MSFTLTRGRAPLLISFPHSGTAVPPGILAQFTDAARALPDTDWHVPLLYDKAAELGAWTIEAHYSRYVVDLNRDPTGESLYPGQSTTTLCPTDTFDGAPIYADAAPDAESVAARVQAYFAPYHRALRDTLDAIQREHGYALLWDAHSIRSQVPRFFDGVLPVLNLGSANGASCDDRLVDAVVAKMNRSAFDSVVDGRFVGGYITRQYGEPRSGIHALQMEIAQSAYMREDGDRGLKPIDRRALSAALTRLLREYLATAKKIHLG